MPRGRLYSFLRPSAARDLDRYLRIRPSSSGGHARPYRGRNPRDVLQACVSGACGQVAGPRPPGVPVRRRSGRVIPAGERSAYGHFQDSDPVREGWEATRAVAEALRAQVIVFQTPASFGPTDANRTALFRFFESIRADAIKGIELRGGWATHFVARICEEIGLVHVVDPFDKESATYGLAYFRLHGSPPGPSMYRYTYTDADLLRLKSICDEYDDSYLMFNNLSMHSDALRFQRILATSTGGAGSIHE